MNAFSALASLRAKLTADQEDLAADLIENIGRFSVDAIETLEIAAEALEWLRIRSDALIAVMGDEMHRPRWDRDAEWLAGAGEVLSEANRLRSVVGGRPVALRGQS